MRKYLSTLLLLVPMLSQAQPEITLHNDSKYWMEFYLKRFHIDLILPPHGTAPLSVDTLHEVEVPAIKQARRRCGLRRAYYLWSPWFNIKDNQLLGDITFGRYRLSCEIHNEQETWHLYLEPY